MQVTKYQRVEMDGKSYDLIWYDNNTARVSVLTKKGPRTLNGYGRANRGNEAAKVIAKAREEANG